MQSRVSTISEHIPSQLHREWEMGVQFYNTLNVGISVKSSIRGNFSFTSPHEPLIISTERHWSCTCVWPASPVHFTVDGVTHSSSSDERFWYFKEDFPCLRSFISSLLMKILSQVEGAGEGERSCSLCTIGWMSDFKGSFLWPFDTWAVRISLDMDSLNCYVFSNGSLLVLKDYFLK